MESKRSERQKMYSAIFLAHLAIGASSGEIKDFSPLFVGAKWRFSEVNSDKAGAGPGNTFFKTWNGQITIHIFEERRFADTVKYTAHFRDSIYLKRHSFGEPQYPDSLFEFNFEIHDGGENEIKVISSEYQGFLQKAFLHHSFPESNVVDSMYRGTAMKIAYEKFASYGRDVGLLNCWDERNGNFHLQEFGGTKFMLQIRKGVHKSGATFGPNNGGNTFVNLLGRAVYRYDRIGKNAWKVEFPRK